MGMRNSSTVLIRESRKKRSLSGNVDWLEPRPMAGLRENVIYFPNPKKIDIL
jgi:hypothetical protein